jgi:hypothetical protein
MITCLILNMEQYLAGFLTWIDFPNIEDLMRAYCRYGPVAVTGIPSIVALP